jgi:hypothetical protein
MIPELLQVIENIMKKNAAIDVIGILEHILFSNITISNQDRLLLLNAIIMYHKIEMQARKYSEEELLNVKVIEATRENLIKRL